MSRTIRRLKGERYAVTETAFHPPHEGHRATKTWSRGYSRELASNEAGYDHLWWGIHGDGRRWGRNIPQWVIAEFHAQADTRDKRRFQRALDRGLLEELVFDRRKNCGWNQW